MSMFQYFPTNYVWSLAVCGALEAGAKIGEIDEACRPLLELAGLGDDSGTEASFHAWQSMADKLIELAAEDEQRGKFRAGEKLQRTALYLQTAERLQAHGFAPRMVMYRQLLDCFQHAQLLMKSNCSRVEIPYANAHIAGLLVRAPSAPARSPLLVMLNGLDSTKEMVYPNAFTQQMTQRGVSLLYLDQPGSGEALRLHGLTAVPETEQWATPVMDWLQQREDIDPARIDLGGVSLGGYYCPRTVAFEPRFALGVVWGTNHDWREVQKRRLKREGENPVPHYWEHVRWVFGAKDMDELMIIAERMHLDGVLDRIRVPFLVTHGEQDRQIPLEYAHRSYEQMVNSPDRELKVFTDREGGVHHVSLDNMANAGAYIAAWVADRLGGHVQ